MRKVKSRREALTQKIKELWLMARPNYYFRILTALTLTAAAAVLAALLIASVPASAQEEGSSFVYGTYPSDQQTGVLRDTNVTAQFWGYADQIPIVKEITGLDFHVMPP